MAGLSLNIIGRAVQRRKPVMRALIVFGLAGLLAACGTPQERSAKNIVSDEQSRVFAFVRDNDAESLEAYLATGGDANLVDEEGETLLHWATGAKGGAEVTQVLLERGALVNAINARGRSALHNAASWCSIDIMALLLGHGADAQLRDGSGVSIEDAVCARPAQRRDEALGLLRGGTEN